MGNNAIVDRRSGTADRQSVPTDQRLRHLLRTGRKAAGSLSQKAAAHRAGISHVYWQKIESGAQQTAPADTLAAMFLAAGVTAGQLHGENYPEIASAMAEIGSMTAGSPTAEEHLAATPGATPEEISFLQAAWQVLKSGRTPDPFDSSLPDSRRRRDGRR